MSKERFVWIAGSAALTEAGPAENHHAALMICAEKYTHPLVQYVSIVKILESNNAGIDLNDSVEVFYKNKDSEN